MDKDARVEWTTDTGRVRTGAILGEFHESPNWRWVRCDNGIDYPVKISELRFTKKTEETDQTPEQSNAGIGPNFNFTALYGGAVANVPKYVIRTPNPQQLTTLTHEFPNGVWSSFFTKTLGVVVTELSPRVREHNAPQRSSNAIFKLKAPVGTYLTKASMDASQPGLFGFWNHPTNTGLNNLVCWRSYNARQFNLGEIFSILPGEDLTTFNIHNFTIYP